MNVGLEHLRVARADLDARIEDESRRLAMLEDDLERIDEAIGVLEHGSAPALSEPELKAPPTPAAGSPLAAASVGGSLNASSAATPTAGRSTDLANGGSSGVTVEQVLEHVGEDWMPGGPIAAAVGLAKDPLRARLRVLIADGRVEVKGERAGTRYRKAGVERAAVAVDTSADKDDQSCATHPDDGSLSITDHEKPDGEPRVDVVVDRKLAGDIEGVLHRAAAPHTANEIARSLVVNVGQVAQQLHVMVKQTENGDRFPGVHRDASGRYSVLVRSAAA